jgi:hypothetical protein
MRHARWVALNVNLTAPRISGYWHLTDGSLRAPTWSVSGVQPNRRNTSFGALPQPNDPQLTPRWPSAAAIAS